MATIDNATVDDLPALLDIYNASMTTGNSNFDTRLATLDERQQWFAQFASTGPHRLLVAGHGTDVLVYGSLFEQLDGEDVHVALAGIALPNKASVALHRKFGFTEVGVFQEYAIVQGHYISSVWMHRLLNRVR